MELVATACDDGTVKVWEGGSEGGKYCVADWNIGCPVTAVCWGPDGNLCYVGALDNLIHVSGHVLTIFLILVVGGLTIATL